MRPDFSHLRRKVSAKMFFRVAAANAHQTVIGGDGNSVGEARGSRPTGFHSRPGGLEPINRPDARFWPRLLQAVYRKNSLLRPRRACPRSIPTNGEAIPQASGSGGNWRQMRSFADAAWPKISPAANAPSPDFFISEF